MLHQKNTVWNEPFVKAQQDNKVWLSQTEWAQYNNQNAAKMQYSVGCVCSVVADLALKICDHNGDSSSFMFICKQSLYQMPHAAQKDTG